MNVHKIRTEIIDRKDKTLKEFFIETERINFSYWTDEDFALAKQLWGEEDVTKYICSAGKFSDREISERLTLEVKNGHDCGVQYWPFFEWETGELVGCCGLRPFKMEIDTYEIGVHMRKKYWGKGYASEAIKAVLDYAFTKLNVRKIFAGHHPQNNASRKLLSRLGFKYIDDNFYEPTGLYHPSYELKNPSEKRLRE